MKIAQWRSHKEPSLEYAMGFDRKAPTKNCLHIFLIGIYPQQLEKVLGHRVDQLVLKATNAFQAIGMDGKTLRDTLKLHGQRIHLRSFLIMSPATS